MGEKKGKGVHLPSLFSPTFILSGLWLTLTIAKTFGLCECANIPIPYGISAHSHIRTKPSCPWTANPNGGDCREMGAEWIGAIDVRFNDFERRKPLRGTTAAITGTSRSRFNEFERRKPLRVKLIIRGKHTGGVSTSSNGESRCESHPRKLLS